MLLRHSCSSSHRGDVRAELWGLWGILTAPAFPPRLLPWPGFQHDAQQGLGPRVKQKGSLPGGALKPWMVPESDGRCKVQDRIKVHGAGNSDGKVGRMRATGGPDPWEKGVSPRAPRMHLPPFQDRDCAWALAPLSQPAPPCSLCCGCGGGTSHHSLQRPSSD